MARTDTLTNYLTDVATAIKTKKGDSTPIQASSFDTEIANLPSGGGPTEFEDSDKCAVFYDYDGTILYEYTESEFLALTNMPEQPSHTGLVTDGWNWDLDEAKAFVRKTHYIDIGSYYMTNDGATNIFITIDDTSSLSMYLGLTAMMNSGTQGDTGNITIDWGDNSSLETLNVTTSTSMQTKISSLHTYPQAGDYTIKILPDRNITFGFEYKSATSNILKMTNAQNNTPENVKYTAMIKKIQAGENFFIGAGAFLYCVNLETITINNETKMLANSSGYFDYCSSLKCLLLPQNYINNKNQTQQSTSTNGPKSTLKLRKILFPNQECSMITFSSTRSGLITRLILTTSTNIPQVFSEMINTKILVLGFCYNDVANYTMMGTTSNPRGPYLLIFEILTSQSISFSSNSLASLANLQLLDLSYVSSIPTVSSTLGSYFNSNIVIVVPDELYDDWIADSSWSAVQNNIVRKSDYYD